MTKPFAAAAIFAALTIPYASAEAAPECHGTTLLGIVRDSTLAVIPGALLTLDSGVHEVSGSDGHFRFACVSDGPHYLTSTAEGFAEHDLSVTTPHTIQLDLVLKPQAVETAIEVDGGAGPDVNATATGISNTISGAQLQSLADDPDDLLNQLQQLAAAAGGNPANTTISVDGFHESVTLPPKSSIAYIKINPDQFSAEYREPPFEGGRVEVYTKPGQKAFHGALFATNGSPFENARDPFSTSKAALGKQRYGFELNGPVRPGVRQGAGSDFALNLEHRSIDNFAVVNAVSLDPAGNTVPTNTNVAAPQRLWVGLARLDWQFGAKNTFISTYSANVNHLVNVGVGGTTLAEGGYDSEKYDHILRFSDITTVSPHFMHEARVSLHMTRRSYSPNSTAPQVQVAGAFTGGGAMFGPQHVHLFTTEIDDDAILTTKSHTLKFGTEITFYSEQRQLPTNFNGTYIFGGGSAPVLDTNHNPIAGQTTTITGIEQYRRAQLHLPGGAASTFSNAVGSPTVNFNQVLAPFFIQDDWNIGHGFHVSMGVRYFFETYPATFSSVTPRAGILWSPTKKGTWTLHAHAGMFSSTIGDNDVAEVQRQDGIQRVTSTIYNPVYGNPFAGATPIHTVRQFSPHMATSTFTAENIGGTRSLPHGWNLSLDYYIGRFWNGARSPNINTPFNGVPTGPRPGVANLNILQMQNSGQGPVNATFAGIEQHTLKRAQFFFGAVRVNIVDDNDDTDLASPQNAYSNVGEFAHRTNQPVWNLFGNGTFKLPGKVQLSTDLEAGGGSHYNITTGFDNNGDGNFNDRPQYAAPGTPGAITTKYGLLVASGGPGVFPRNKGVLPWTIGLDANLQRAFSLTRNASSEHPQSLTVNLRSANVLNHTNVTSVGGVLGSPLFGTPYAATTGRRIEAGLRYSF